ncbi:MAG: hypothetical protein IT438_13740 [Phycisphaerales bacterium]|nr:hypothetical protein [Phycisphaerales bacterium]
MPWDPFSVLGLKRVFDLSSAEIERAYLARVASPPAAADGDGPGADLNRARRELKDPESRANALLGLLGGPAKEQDRSLPDGFLMEMMAVRERMESEGEPARTGWEEWGEARREELRSATADLFRQLDGAPSPATDRLRAIRRQLNAWRYIERMLEQTGGL